MRRFWTFTLVLLLFTLFSTACDNEIIANAFDFDFQTIDKESNQINLTVTTRYKLTNRLEKKLVKEYGRHYKDSLFIPAVSSISRGILKEYSAGEIYNYKRDEIEEKVREQTKSTFAEYDVDLTDFIIRSVELSDTLMRRLEKEHLDRFNKKEKQDDKH